MNPSGRALPGASTLKTARLLLSALATKRIWPSGVRARLLGVLPLGAAGYKAQLIVSSPLPAAKSMTLTRVEFEHATNNVFSPGPRTISVG
jgi:hypothetical protein